MAVFLFLAGCSGGSKASFKANPEATVDVPQVQAMITRVAQPLGLRQISTQQMPMPGEGAPTCNQEGIGCRVAGPPGLNSVFRDIDGGSAVVRVLIGADTKEAQSQLASQVAGYESLTSGVVRALQGGLNSGLSGPGPCEKSAAASDDKSCVWKERKAVAAGDDAKALWSDTIAGRASSALVFVRGSLVASIEVTKSDAKAASDEADRLGLALDAEMKQALSR